MSLKLKITLWYTAVMLAVSAALLAVTASVSQGMLEKTAADKLTSTVNDFSRRLFKPGESRQPTPEKGFYENGVHMAVYDENGELIAGNIPFETDSPKSIAAGFSSAESDGEKYFIYKKGVPDERSPRMYAIGVIPLSAESFALESSAKTNAALVIAMLLIAAGGGYLIISGALAPVRKISATAKKICESSDLTQRIKLGAGGDEIHGLANTFDDMLDKIEQLMEKEKQFTSDASHELRTPAAVIMSECEYMTDCNLSADEMKESAESIKRQTERMTKLISELLMISRMDKNTIAAQFEETDLSELLEFVCDEQEELHGGAVRLARSVAPGITASADRGLMTRLFINIISNAYSYIGSGDLISVSLYKNGENVIFETEDNGIGISEEDLPKIWERFYRADKARTAENSANSGLGLSMAKWIANLHGGKMSVESVLGKGSKFTFSMPLK